MWGWNIPNALDSGSVASLLAFAPVCTESTEHFRAASVARALGPLGGSVAPTGMKPTLCCQLDPLNNPAMAQISAGTEVCLPLLIASVYTSAFLTMPLASFSLLRC